MLEVDAEPFPYQFDPARAALVVIDMQRDFLEPGGFGETRHLRLRPSCRNLVLQSIESRKRGQ